MARLNQRALGSFAMLLFVLSIGLGIGNPAEAQTFQSSVTCNVQTQAPGGNGIGPYAIAVADFNGDHHLDIAIIGQFTNTVSVFLGNGDGSFKFPTTYLVGSAPSSIVVGDFNGDGHPDIAVTGTTTLVVLLGNGDGTFKMGESPFVGSGGGTAIAAGDFNKDGNLDLAVADFSGFQIFVLLGNGDGTFQPKVSYPTGLNAPPYSYPASVAVGDFNGDGNLDLVTANSNLGDSNNTAINTLSVLLGNGDGTFQPAVTTDITPQVTAGISLIAQDLNSDKKLDLAMANFSNSAISTLIGNGDGTFRSPLNYAAGAGPLGIAVGDFNGDGFPDLIVSNDQADSVSLFLNDGTGNFVFNSSLSTGVFPAGLAVGDFDEDKKLDFVIANYGDGTFETYLTGTGPGANACALGGAGTGSGGGSGPGGTGGSGGTGGTGGTGGKGGNGGSGGSGGSGSCNCTLTGNYVNPVAAADPTNDSLTSPHNKYTVSASQDNADQLTTLTVKNSSGAVVFNQTLPISTNWGFSPDDDRFVVNFVDSENLNEVQVWDLSTSPAKQLVQTSILTSASRLQFSPSGRYFLNTTLVNSSTTQLQIYRVQGVTAQDLVFQTQFAFAVGSGSDDQFGAVNWGFSPDNPETSFVFAYATGQGSIQWNLVNLAAGRQIQSQSLTTVAAFWQFDPCGDVAALVTQPSGSSDQIALYDTTTGQALAGSGASVPSLSIALETTSTGQEVQYSGQTVALSPSTCGQPNTPTGANVSVTPKDSGSSTSPVSITFANVTQAGETTVSIGATGPSPAAPTDFQLGNPPTYYDLSTTAGFSGTSTVCINYSGVSFANQSAIRLYHFANGSWVDITTSVNPAAQTVCGNTSSFSPFALFEPTSPLPASIVPSTGTPQQATINASFATALQATVIGTDGNPMSGIVVTFTAPTTGATGIFTGLGSQATATTGENGVAIAPPFVADGMAGVYTVTASANGVSTPAVFSLTNAKGTPVIAWTPATPIVYGTPLGASQLNATSSLAGSFTYTPASGTVLGAGNQTLSVSFAPTDSIDYTSATASAAINVTPASLAITAASSSRSYGQANPLFTATYSGFVNGDTTTVLAGTLNCTTTATPSSPVGTYPITCSGLTATNYAISFVPGVLTVTQAVAAITANNLTKTLDSPNPALTFTASGFVNGDTVSVLTTLPTCTTTATTTSAVGSYPITCSGAAALNYTFTYVSGTLTVLAPTCHYVSLTLSPATVELGGLITVKGELMSCASTLQVIAEEFTLAGPLNPETCGQAETVMLKTPVFPLPPKTAQSIAFPFRIPERSCAGNYTVTVNTLLNGKIVDTSLTTLSVTTK